MKRRNIYICLVILICLSLYGCSKKEDGHNVKESETEQVSQGSETEMINSEIVETEEELAIKWVKNTLNGGENIWNYLFSQYDTDKNIQRIPSQNIGDEYAGVTIRHDTIFYCSDNQDIQVVVKTMLDEMITPLMKESENRMYTIIRYELDEEQPLIQINDSVWILEIISGYYEYEGMDFVTMEEAMPYEPKPKDGMVTFFAQGSPTNFYYVILEKDGVYRIQKLSDMMLLAETYQSSWK